MSHRGGGQLDYFSQVRGPVVDQWAALRRTTETRLEAKLSALRAKALQAKDPKNRTQRKVYIGNVLPTLTTDFLRQLFTKTLLISFPQWNVPGVDIIVDVSARLCTNTADAIGPFDVLFCFLVSDWVDLPFSSRTPLRRPPCTRADPAQGGRQVRLHRVPHARDGPRSHRHQRDANHGGGGGTFHRL